MQVLRAAGYRRVPWKNGGGTTAEIAVFPADATIADFDWRISMADVASDGPFSAFENVDRTLTVLDGEGIELSVEGSDPVELRQHSAPYSFAGDAPTTARLLGGRMTDLNVMARRGKASCSVKRQPSGPVEAASTGVTLVFALNPCTTDGQELLGPKDCAFLEPGDVLELDLDKDTSVLIIHVLGVG